MNKSNIEGTGIAINSVGGKGKQRPDEQQPAPAKMPAKKK